MGTMRPGRALFRTDPKPTRLRKLRVHPAHWDEIMLRLKHRCSSRRVEAWYVATYPKDRPPHFNTLNRFVPDQPAGWFINPLLFTGQEARLRHRWSSRRVEAWYVATYPKDRPPHFNTLNRFVPDQPQSGSSTRSSSQARTDHRWSFRHGGGEHHLLWGAPK